MAVCIKTEDMILVDPKTETLGSEDGYEDAAEIVDFPDDIAVVSDEEGAENSIDKAEVVLGNFIYDAGWEFPSIGPPSLHFCTPLPVSSRSARPPSLF